jgi:hypothetical protein
MMVGHMSGYIEPRPPPTVGGVSYTFSPFSSASSVSNWVYNATITSDVYFDYFIFTSDTAGLSVGDINYFIERYAGLETGVGNVTTDPISEFVNKNAVSSGFTDFYSGSYPNNWDKPTISFTGDGNYLRSIIHFTSGISGYDYNDDFTPWIDSTKTLTSYVYAVNASPQAGYHLETFTSTPLYTAKSIFLSVNGTNENQVEIFSSQTGFAISFKIRPTSITAPAVLVYLGVFDETVNINTGAGKLKLITNFIKTYEEANIDDVADLSVSNDTITEYYDGANKVSITTGKTYYIYALLLDKTTGESSTIVNMSYTPTTNDKPELVRSAGSLLEWINVESGDSGGYYQFTTDTDTYVKEEQNFSIWIGLFDRALVSNDNQDNKDDIITFMKDYTTNGGTSGTVRQYLNIGPANSFTFGSGWQIPQNVLQKHQFDLGDVSNGWGSLYTNKNYSLVTYIEDLVDPTLVEWNINDTGTRASNNDPTTNITLIKALDTGFEIKCPEATPDLTHYILAFDSELASIDAADWRNIKNNAEYVINNTDPVTVNQYWDGTQKVSMIPTSTYYIYSVAIDDSTYVIGHSIIDGITKHEPVITFVRVNFDSLVGQLSVPINSEIELP